MPAQIIKVTPQVLLQAAASVAATAERAATPHPGEVPEATLGSPADTALVVIAQGIKDQSTEMYTKLAGKGPETQSKTQAGVAQLQAQDEENAAQIRSVGDSAETGSGAIGGAPGSSV